MIKVDLLWLTIVYDDTYIMYIFNNQLVYYSIY